MLWSPRIRSKWATFGQIRSILSLLRDSVRRAPDSGHYLLISGQDYPIVPVQRMVEFFAEHPGTSFIDCQPMPLPCWADNGGMDRLHHWHFVSGAWRLEYPTPEPPPARRMKVAYEICRRLLPPKRTLPKSIALYGGANWWNLSRDAALGLLEYARVNRAFNRMFHFSRSGDEIYFQTALMNSGTWKLALDTLRCVFWDGRDYEFPCFVRSDDFDRIADSSALFLRQIQQQHWSPLSNLNNQMGAGMFVRKIHPQRSLDLLDRIDRELLGLK